MDAKCRQPIAAKVLHEASRKFADLSASARGRTYEYKCPLAISRTEDFARYASDRKMSAIVRCGLGVPPTRENGKELRISLRDVWRSAAGEARQQSAERRATIDARGLPRGATLDAGVARGDTGHWIFTSADGWGELTKDGRPRCRWRTGNF